MNKKQLDVMSKANGFIAALDQSGGSTPKALMAYGIHQDRYNNEEEMYQLVHAMRTRIIKSPSFTNKHILGAILFENTMDRKIDGEYTADYLWNEKGIVPFLKIDKGLADLKDGVQLLKPMPELEELLKRAVKRNVFGTKERSLIKEANKQGIENVVKQQFDVARLVIKHGLVPIIEPEVDINSKDKELSEDLLLDALTRHLNQLDASARVIFKLSIPTEANLYAPLMKDPRVVRVVALSGGYSREVANSLLAKNHGLIASFSRALSEGLSDKQTDKQFDDLLITTVKSIYDASIK